MRYCKSTIFQANHNMIQHTPHHTVVVCDTAKVRFFKQITTGSPTLPELNCCLRYCKSTIFQANHNKNAYELGSCIGCLRYCKSTIFQANHNPIMVVIRILKVVCDTAKVRFFKQITTELVGVEEVDLLFAILQKYDFSSKSQRCQRYALVLLVVCDTAKVRFFKQITT